MTRKEAARDLIDRAEEVETRQEEHDEAANALGDAVHELKDARKRYAQSWARMTGILPEVGK